MVEFSSQTGARRIGCSADLPGVQMDHRHGNKAGRGLILVKSEQKQTDARIIRAERTQLDKRIQGLQDRIVEADSLAVIAALEKRFGKMECEKLTLDEKRQSQNTPPHSFERMFEHAMHFPANPWKL
ncbi:hypothetical protein [Aliiroseovarius halocynthiae]|uniref:Uncharacterized protein n=1 Tax=Aliiroseovarius halocynthiae TaxID=985055 RepID=A0A545SW03_9RHOB|nr:hypothetical protein [Aliiroseovarius halocynthiae]TQV69131.1 hypothetical protein FIL88_06060 [Aliiroseovarius halocynthiae]